MKNSVIAFLAISAVTTMCGIRLQGQTGNTRSEFTEAGLMRTESNSKVVREVALDADLIVCGGGLSGVCAAVSAARHGVSVILVQDRSVLGGNASSEMRMGIVGVHGDSAMETGILEELQLKNFYYNPLQRYTLWDDVIYSTVVSEPNIRLLLNTSVENVTMNNGNIESISAWNTNAYTRYTISGKLFADCTGDGILRLSGAKFRRGRELPGEFGESYLSTGGDSRTMGNSILLQLRKTEVDVPFHAPDWAYHFTDADFNYSTPKSTIKGVKFNYKRLYPNDNNFWWIEFGGNYDTIFDANDIQYELKRIAYGVWEYMKNNPDGRCNGYELDWIGAIPGKRESTRYIGPYVFSQKDALSGGHFEDVIAYGGWTLDDHDPEAFHKKGSISSEYSTPDYFGIPFGCLYSVNVPNLMFAGRDISATHMGLSATRVMSTCALLGQAAGIGAAVALKYGETPAQAHKNHISEIQDILEDDDCMLPYRWRKVSELTASAKTDPANEVVRNSIDRNWYGTDNGVWLAPGEKTLVYEWDRPVKISGIRLVFDSDLKVRGKRMRKLEATTEMVQMPPMMPRRFHIVFRQNGKSTKRYYLKDENFLRYRKITFDDPIEADAVRIVIDSTWGAPKAHIFAFDVL